MSYPALPVLQEDPAADDLDRARAKLGFLDRALRRYVANGAVVAISGGLDSAFLLWAAVRSAERGGGRVVALTTISASTPDADVDDARSFCILLGCRHIWRQSRELRSEAYARNDASRCYHCKAELFRIATEVAAEERCEWLLYGYNASDQGDTRPGHRAALERGVVSPLLDAGLTKAEIRVLAAAEDLPVWDKPASPCLASRVTTGMRVNEKRLDDVRQLEALLRTANIRLGRARICPTGEGSFVRIEVDPSELAKVLPIRDLLVELGRSLGYRWVTLDLAGYRMGGATQATGPQ